jgi:hypothetical protein
LLSPPPDIRRGIFLDADRFDYQLAIRGGSARQLARRARVSEAIISRARHGHRIAPQTLRKITVALLAWPIVSGFDLLVARPDREPE